MDDLEKLLAEEEKETQAPASTKADETEKEDKEVLKIRAEREKEEQHLANIRQAIKEANQILTTKSSKINKIAPEFEEDDIPKIDMDDPSSKAWNRHITQTVKPVQEELEKEKEEIRSFALQEFLSDKPALAKNTEKVKELMANFQRISTSTGRTKEGVLLDLNKAYAATFHEELLQAVKQDRIDKAKADSIFADIAVSRGATAYQNKSVPNDNEPKTDEERIFASKLEESFGKK